MNATKIIAAAFAALLLSAGTVAALPGQAADAGTDHANEHADDAMQASEDANESETKSNASENKPAAAADAAERRGPPTDMPEQVPDHVVQIHETINQFLDGDLDGSLGEAISDLTPGEEDAEDADARYKLKTVLQFLLVHEEDLKQLEGIGAEDSDIEARLRELEYFD